MIHRIELLDPLSILEMPESDRRLVDGAQNVGHAPRHLNTEHYGSGAMQQVVIPSALIACGCGGPGAESDISEGCSSIRDMYDEISFPPNPEGAVG